MKRRSFVLLLPWAAACHRPEAKPAVHAEAKPVVATTTVIRTEMTRTLELTGELVPFQEVEVMAKVAGYVQRIFVDVGDVVRQGQVLAVLEIPEMKDWMKDGDARCIPIPNPQSQMIQIHQFPCLSDNYGFLVHDPATKTTTTIDTPDAEKIMAEADARGWRITDIWNTHWHPDHAGGN